MKTKCSHADIKRGRLIRYYRVRLGLTQIDLAEKLEVSLNTVCSWEKGYIKPTVKHWYKLCQLLQIPAEYLEEDLTDPFNARKLQLTLIRQLNLSPDTLQQIEEAIDCYYGKDEPLKKVV